MNKDFKRLTFIDSVWGFVYYLIAPILPIYFKQIGGIESVGISISIILIIQGVISFISVRLLKKSMKKILLISQIAEGIRILLFIFVNNIFFVYTIQFLGGITKGLIVPSYNKIFVDSGDDENNSAFKQRNGFLNIFMGLGALFSGFVVTYFGYVPLFILWGLMEMSYGIYVYFNV